MSGMYTEAVVVMDVGRKQMVVKCDVYIQALYISFLYIKMNVCFFLSFFVCMYGTYTNSHF